jgi:hypothetical protein
MLRLLTIALLAANLSPVVLASGEKLSRLQGSVRLTRSKTVVGAAVVVRNESDPGRFWLTSSGEDGKFFVDQLPDGDYRVRISREGYTPAVKDNVVLKFPFRAVVEVSMVNASVDLGAAGEAPASGTPPVGIRGRVHDVEGKGIGETWVRVVRQDGSADPVARRTPPDGRFDFAGLPPGEWRLEVIGIGYLPLRQRLMIATDTECAVQLVRQPPDYEPSPIDLMPPEAPVIPEGFAR